jgi:1,4-alpha-glucan branching enzyme
VTRQPNQENTRQHAQPITEDDLHLFNEGSHYHLYRKLGCHLTTLGGTAGATFAVWAPSARAVSVIGDFNGWDPRTHRLATRGASGIWEASSASGRVRASGSSPHAILNTA